MLTALSREQVLSYETQNDESISWVVTLGRWVALEVSKDLSPFMFEVKQSWWHCGRSKRQRLLSQWHKTQCYMQKNLAFRYRC